MKNKLLFLLVASIIFICNHTYATHMLGGDVTYKCLGDNKFRISVKIYQNCVGNTEEAIAFDNPIYYAIYENSITKPLVKAGQVELTKVEKIDHGFSNECVDKIPNVCMQVATFEVDVELPESSYGYVFASQRCCRNSGIINIRESGNIGITYTVTIPPHTLLDCNSSPYFSIPPPQIICVNNNFLYYYNAKDDEGDSLVYRLCNAYSGGSTSNPKPIPDYIDIPPYPSVPYNPGYNAENPITAVPPAFINSTTGLLSFLPTQLGRFVINVCVDQYRDGNYVSTINRDVQFLVTDCSKKTYADIPVMKDQSNTYKVVCNTYQIDFIHESVGATSYFWEFGDGDTSTLASPSHVYKDTGTYLVKLTINKGSTCEDFNERFVKVYPFLNGTMTKEGKRCPLSTITFTPSVNNTLDYKTDIYWDFGDGSEIIKGDIVKHQYEKGGVYNIKMILKNELGCEETMNDTLYIGKIEPNAGNDTMIVLDYEYYLNGTGGNNYKWSPSDIVNNASIGNPLFIPKDTGEYRMHLDVTTIDGCEGKDSVNIIVVSKAQFLMPNAFSPNNDGLNDLFMPNIVGYKSIDLFRIYNRWGENVYVGYKNKDGWDGTYNNQKAEAGVYYWYIEATDAFGKKAHFKGDVTLIR